MPRVSLSVASGGELGRGSFDFVSGYAEAQCIGKPSYLKPNRDSMHLPIEGLSRS